MQQPGLLYWPWPSHTLVKKKCGLWNASTSSNSHYLHAVLLVLGLLFFATQDTISSKTGEWGIQLASHSSWVAIFPVFERFCFQTMPCVLCGVFEPTYFLEAGTAPIPLTVHIRAEVFDTRMGDVQRAAAPYNPCCYSAPLMQKQL